MLLFLGLLFLLNSVSSNKSTFLTTYVGLQNDHNLGHSGYTYLSSDPEMPELKLSTCQYLDLNITTCDSNYKRLKNRESSLIVRAWVAVTLRDNILSFVSYLSHQLKEKFSDDVDTSLFVIYDELRKNHIRTMDFLPKLKSISKLDKGTQLVALFKNLQFVMQPFCKSQLELLTRTMYKLKKSRSRADNNIYAYIKNGQKIKYHEIDLFTDIGFETMFLLQSKLASRHSDLDKDVYTSFGREFSLFFQSIKDGKILLTQPVLAALTANMKFIELTPRQIEDLRFLIDVLRGNKVNHWSPELIGSSHIRSPHILIESMFRSIASNHDVDPLLSEIAAGLQGKLQQTQQYSMTKVMEPFFGDEELNIALIFEVMQQNVRNHGSVDLLKTLFDDETINPFYALKGFVRYHYNSPVKLVIGFLRRLQLRVPINKEIMDLTSGIIDDLSDSETTVRFKNCAPCNKSNKDGSDHDRNDDENKGKVEPDTSDKPQEYRINYELIKPKLPFNQFVCNPHDEMTTPAVRFKEMGNPIEICEDPPKPSMDWLKNIDLPANNLDLKALIAEASSFLSEFIEENEEIRNFIEGVLVNETQDASREVSLRAVTYKGSVRQLLIRLFKRLINVNKVRARSLIYFESIKIYCKLINGHDNHIFDASSFKLDDPARNNSIDLFKGLVSDSLQKVIDSYNVTSHSAIFWNNYTTNRQLVSDMCRAYLTQPNVIENDDLFNEVVFILHRVYHVPVKFVTLLNIHTVNKVHEIRTFDMVQELLKKPNVMQMLGDDFDLGRYPTKGVMLKAVLLRLKNHDIVRRNLTLFIAVQAQLHKIACSGHWMEPADKIVSDALTDQIDIEKVFDLGLDREKLSPVVKNAFLNMWNWYGGIFNPIIYIKKMNVSGYESRSHFIDGFLNSITQDVKNDHAKVLQDVDLMRSAVLRTENGLDPVDFL